MNLVKSLAFVAGSGGVVATGAYFTKDFWMTRKEKVKNSRKSIFQLLSDEKYKPLDTYSATGWSEVLEKRNAVYVSETKDVSALQSECRDLLSKEKFIDTDYQKARRWCVEMQTVEARLKLFGGTPLSTDTAVSTDDDKWKIKIGKHKKDHSNKFNHTFGDEENQNLTDIKAKCKEIGAKNNTDENFEKDFSKYSEWCSVAS